MNKKNKELATAVVVLSAVSLALCGVVFLIAIIAMLSVSVFGDAVMMGNVMVDNASVSVIGGADGPTSIFLSGSPSLNGMFGFMEPFIGMMVVIFLIGLAVKICALVFAVKGKNQNKSGYILTSSILNAVCILSGDIIAIAAAICGFILYDGMNKEENGKSDDGENLNLGYEDNIYGMKN